MKKLLNNLCAQGFNQATDRGNQVGGHLILIGTGYQIFDDLVASSSASRPGGSGVQLAARPAPDGHAQPI